MGINNHHINKEELRNNTQFNTAGFDQLFNSFFPTLCYYAFSIVKDMQEAEDISIGAFMKLWERWEQMQSSGKCKAYLYTCTRNACIDILRRERTKNVNEKDWKSLHANTEDGILDKIIEAELAGQLNRALETLPPACQKICNMIFNEGMNSREVAETLKLSISTVKTQKQRALNMLKKKLLKPLLCYIIPFLICCLCSPFYGACVSYWRRFYRQIIFTLIA